MTQDEIILAQQARIEQLRETLQHFALIDLGRDSVPSTFGMDVLASRKALSTHDDLSALKAHDEKLLKIIKQKDEAILQGNLSLALSYSPDTIEKGGM